MPNTALIIIDMQTALVTGAFREHEVLERVGLLADKCRAAKVPVIYIQHNHASFEPMMKGQPGWNIHSAIAPEPGDLVIEKQASDAFYATELGATLRSLGIDTVMVTGMQTEYCVDATARSALSHEFDVVLISDCHTTGNAVITAEQIIAHHNATLPNVVHPSAAIRAVPSAEIAFP
ncbi:MAG: cysteine hydrolase family protein [Gammaproteobacteria bacterium]|nr:cysteine hydrolase family protein [Gammaproteobacteria bacterium]